MIRFVLVILLAASCCGGDNSDRCMPQPKLDFACGSDGSAWTCATDDAPFDDCYRAGYGSAFNVAWCCP